MHDGEYEEYLKDRSNVEYYIPTKEELHYYMENEFNEDILFKGFDKLNEFAQMFMNLSNTTRKWGIKGHKPTELAREKSKSIKRDKKDNVIPFPQPGSAKAKKIGRNELCPCGSGKKYKFCCGK